MGTILQLLNGKKTYIGIILALISMVTGIDISEGDLTVVLDQTQTIIAAVGVIIAVIGRAVAEPKK